MSSDTPPSSERQGLESEGQLNSQTNKFTTVLVDTARRRSSLLNSSSLKPKTTLLTETHQGIDEPFTLGRSEESVTEGPVPRRLSNLGVPRRASFHGLDSGLPSMDFANTVARKPSLLGIQGKNAPSQMARRPVSIILLAIGAIAMVFLLLTSTLYTGGDAGSFDEVGSMTGYHMLMTKHKVDSYTLVPNLVRRHRGVERLLQQVFLSSNENPSDEPVELQVQIGQVNTTLDLTPSDAIFPSHRKYKEIRVIRSTNSWRVRRKNSKTKRCVFEAQVRGDPDSFGTVTLCDGRVDVAMMNYKDANKGFSLTQIDASMHVLITGASAVSPSKVLRCGESDPGRRTEALLNKPEDEQLISSGRNLQTVFRPRGERNKTVKILVVNDAARYDLLESSTESNTVAIMQLIRSIYSQVYSATSYGIDIELIGQITFIDGIDGWNTASDPDTGLVDSQNLLNDFYAWKQANDAVLPDADLVHLFSGREFLDGIVGRSSQGGVCDERNVGVDQLVGFDMTLYSRIAAHEIGHGLTLYHDNTYSDPTCTSSTDTFMWPYISMGANPKWTSCAIAAWQAFFDGKPSPFTYLGCLEDSVSPVPSASPSRRSATKSPTLRTSAPVVRRTSYPTPSSNAPTSKSPISLSPTRSTSSTPSPTNVALPPSTLSPTTKTPSESPTNPPTDPPTNSPTLPNTPSPSTPQATLMPATPSTTARPTHTPTSPTNSPTRIVIIPVDPTTDSPSTSPTTSNGLDAAAASGSSEVAVAAGAGGVSAVFASVLAAFAVVMWRRKNHPNFIAAARESLRGPKPVIKPQVASPPRSRVFKKGDPAETSGRELSVHNDQESDEEDPPPLPKPPKVFRKAPLASDGPNSVISRDMSTQTDAEQTKQPESPLPLPKPRAFKRIIRRTDAPPAISRELSTHFDLEQGFDGEQDDPTPLPGSSLVFTATKKETGKLMRPSDLSVS